tara:strand:+ start:2063 stop:3301 length:1239 start_codon:yes stop_codon:yes gene_type:complete
MSSNNYGPSPHLDAENINPVTGLNVTPLRGNIMTSPPALERGRSTGLSNRDNNYPGDLASRMEEMSNDNDIWWTGDTPDKLGVTPLSVIEANEGNPLFEKDYGAYMPANASNPVHRALIKPLYDSRSRQRLDEQRDFSMMYLEDYIRANNLDDGTESVDKIRREIGWPIEEVYKSLNSELELEERITGGSPVTPVVALELVGKMHNAIGIHNYISAGASRTEARQRLEYLVGEYKKMVYLAYDNNDSESNMLYLDILKTRLFDVIREKLDTFGWDDVRGLRLSGETFQTNEVMKRAILYLSNALSCLHFFHSMVIMTEGESRLEHLGNWDEFKNAYTELLEYMEQISTEHYRPDENTGAVVGGKRKSKRRLGKSRKGRNSKKSKKTRKTRKTRKSKKTRKSGKTKKPGRKTR